MATVLTQNQRCADSSAIAQSRAGWQGGPGEAVRVVTRLTSPRPHWPDLPKRVASLLCWLIRMHAQARAAGATPGGDMRSTARYGMPAPGRCLISAPGVSRARLAPLRPARPRGNLVQAGLSPTRDARRHRAWRPAALSRLVSWHGPWGGGVLRAAARRRETESPSPSKCRRRTPANARRPPCRMCGPLW